MNSVHNPDTGLYGPFIKISIPLCVNRHPSIPPFQQSHKRRNVGVFATNQHLTGMHVQSDDEVPGSSKSTAKRVERQEMLWHFVPVNMLSEKTVERMKKMEGRRRQGLMMHYCNYMTQNKYGLVNHSRTQPFIVNCVLRISVRRAPSKCM